KGEDMREAVLKMREYIVHTTVADYVKLDRYVYEHKLTNFLERDSVVRAVAAGEGFIDYESFLGALKEIGYQGYIAYEMCEVLEGGGEVENLDKTAKKFLEYVKKL
ncbi:MAG: sugar phosphate isomerase/epimerase, partial [Planctomycetota bacterium]